MPPEDTQLIPAPEPELVKYEVDYVLNDPAFFEPFEVYKAVAPGLTAWWSDQTKVTKLFDAFKMNLTVNQACIFTGISPRQYNYFCTIHPLFVPTKARLKGTLSIAAKRGLMYDINNRDNPRARQWFLERTEPNQYGRAPEMAPTNALPAEADAMTTISRSAFTDKDGNILVTKDSYETIKKHDGN